MSNEYIAPFIRRDEFWCKCCHRLPVDLYTQEAEPEFNAPYLMLFKYFQDFRQAWGKPIPVSGYRCEDRNAAVGGNPCSVHLFGLALDCDFKDAQEVSKAALLINQIAPQLRIGIYKVSKTFIHIDVGYYIFPRVSEKWSKGVRWYG